MIWPFKPRLVEDEIVAWQLEAFEWFIANLTGPISLTETPLFIPGDGHFVSDGERGHALAQRIFDQVRGYVGIPDTLRIDLIAQPPRRDDILGPGLVLHHDKPEPLGSCRTVAPEHFEISYDPALIDDPENMISTFAHELGHVLIPAEVAPSISPEEYELFIDLSVAFFGFGIFLSNTRLERIVDGDWVKWRGGGYLPINDRLMATALLIALKDSDADKKTALSWLRPVFRTNFQLALKQLKRFESELSKLRDLDREVVANCSVMAGSGA